jgi:hypothetical protein
MIDNIKSSLLDEKGFSKNRTMVLHGLIPPTIVTMMDVVCGKNWQDDADVKPQFDDVFEGLRINHKSVPKIRSSPRQIDGTVEESREKMAEELDQVDEWKDKLKQANVHKRVIAGPRSI